MLLSNSKNPPPLGVGSLNPLIGHLPANWPPQTATLRLQLRCTQSRRPTSSSSLRLDLSCATSDALVDERNVPTRSSLGSLKHTTWCEVPVGFEEVTTATPQLARHDIRSPNPAAVRRTQSRYLCPWWGFKQEQSADSPFPDPVAQAHGPAPSRSLCIGDDLIRSHHPIRLLGNNQRQGQFHLDEVLWDIEHKPSGGHFRKRPRRIH